MQKVNKDQVKQFLQKKSSSMTSAQIMSGINFLKEYGYNVQDLIDCGQFGIVMKAIEAESDRVVAIKQMIISSSDALKDAISEFQRVLLLKSPYIIKFYQQLYDDDNETFFIISEFCANGNLFNYVKNKQINKGEIVTIISSLIEGVIHIHQKKLIHSDLKPQNILLGDNNIIKICDLGLSKMMKGNKSNTSAKGGTIAYMPKEQMSGELRQECDIFAIGAIICFICGLGIEDNITQMLDLKNGLFPSIENNQLSDILKIAFKMMALQPQQRLSLSDALQQIQNLASSQITIENKDGQYVGEMKNQVRHGQGTQIYSNAYSDLSKYSGEWIDDQPNGEGVYEFSDGNKYVGSVLNGQFNGKGVFYWKSPGLTSKKYDGQWENNYKSGFGFMEYYDGDTFEGHYKYGRRNGLGTYYWNSPNSTSKKYEGEYLNDIRNGFGVEEFQNGDVYEGNYQDNKRNGQGTFYYSQGVQKVYEGEWMNNKKHGQGVLQFKNGKIQKGNWKDDQFVN